MRGGLANKQTQLLSKDIEVIDLAATHRADLAVIARFSENEARP